MTDFQPLFSAFDFLWGPRPAGLCLVSDGVCILSRHLKPQKPGMKALVLLSSLGDSLQDHWVLESSQLIQVARSNSYIVFTMHKNVNSDQNQSSG